MQRSPSADEVGGPPRPAAGEIPIAVVRRGERLPFDDPAGRILAAGDVVVFLQAR